MPATASGLRTRLLKSSTFRLTLVHLLVFSSSALALLTFVYLLGTQFMERQTMDTVEAEIQGLREQYALQGLEGLRRIIDHRSQNGAERFGFYLLTDRDDQRLAGNLPHWPKGVALKEDDTLRFAVQDTNEKGVTSVRPVIAKALLVQGKDGAIEGRLLVGRDVTEQYLTQIRLRNAILWGGVVMLLFGLGGGYAMSRYLLKKLEVINRTTTKIMAGNLGERVAVESIGDEFDDLAQNLNAMLERIERLLAGMREVTDNIAHDLRTPLSRIRSRIEVALMRDLGSAEGRELLEATMRDADLLIATFNALLNIARAEAGAQQSEWEPLDLAQIARDVFELYEPLAEEKAMQLRLEAAEGTMVVGNGQLLAQAIANLIDNAIKYAPGSSTVLVRTMARPQPAVVVADHGPGIPVELRPKALERFVRLHPERTSPGNGLGLSLVSAVARLHGATLELDDNQPGLKVTLTFKPAPKDRSGRTAAATPSSRAEPLLNEAA